MAYCEIHGNAYHGHCTECPTTPARGEPMPQTRPYWEKRAERDQELILKQKGKIESLEQTINQLRQKK